MGALDAFVDGGERRVDLAEVNGRVFVNNVSLVSGKRDYHQLLLFVNETAKKHELLIPVYKMAEKPMIEHGDGARFEIDPNELKLLNDYVNYVGDDRVLMALHDAEPKKIRLLNESMQDTERFYKQSEKAYRNINLLVRRIFDYFGVRRNLKG